MNVSSAIALALATMAGIAWQRAASSDIGTRIESCVSEGVIEFGSTDQRALLDADDQARVLVEMQKRYPVLAHHGFPVSKIVLWQKTGGQALFVTLLDHPHKAQETCFTATFAAGPFDGIALLKRKYLRPELSI